MLVKELIAILNTQDPDDEVRFAYNSRDYWNTEVTDPVEEVFKENVQWSEYHSTYKVMTEKDSGIFKTVTLLK